MSDDREIQARVAVMVSLIVSSRQRSISEIIDDLGLPPDQTDTQTHTITTGKRLKQAEASVSWSENERSAAGTILTVSHLVNTCVSRLLDRTECLAAPIQTMGHSVSPQLAITFGSDFPIDTVRISGELLTRIARLGMPMGITHVPLSSGWPEPMGEIDAQRGAGDPQ